MANPAQDPSVATRALRRIQRWGPGRVFVPRDLLDQLDPRYRGAVDVALHRLAAADKIRRLARGVYDYPKRHPRFGRLTPSTDDIARAIARSTNETVVLSGATTANMLGLSTQIPARPVYLTNGTSRTVHVGKQVIRFRHAAPSRMVGHDTKPGSVLRALRFLGRDGIDDVTIAHLRSILNATDLRGLRKLQPDAPSWMRPIIDNIVSTGTFDGDDDDGDQRTHPPVRADGAVLARLGSG